MVKLPSARAVLMAAAATAVSIAVLKTAGRFFPALKSIPFIGEAF